MLSKSMARICFLGGTIVTFMTFLGLSRITLYNEIAKATHHENITLFFIGVGIFGLAHFLQQVNIYIYEFIKYGQLYDETLETKIN